MLVHPGSSQSQVRTMRITHLPQMLQWWAPGRSTALGTSTMSCTRMLQTTNTHTLSYIKSARPVST